MRPARLFWQVFCVHLAIVLALLVHVTAMREGREAMIRVQDYVLGDERTDKHRRQE
jgi:hypothetical protein